MSKASENRQIAKDLRSKLKLEATFRPEVRKVFSKMLKDFTWAVSVTGRQQPLTRYTGAWKSTIENHYDRVFRKFEGTVKVTKGHRGLFSFKLDDIEEEEENRLSSLLAFAFLDWADNRSDISVNSILNTTEKNMNDSLFQARELIRDQGLPSDNRTLAKTSKAILRRKFAGRVENIVITETQAPAETTKYLEAQTAVGLEPAIVGVIGGALLKKKWRDVGDSKVRDIHREANNQIRNMNEAFYVGNEYLMYPGDSSLGASMKNIAGCRCSSVYIF